MLLLAGAIFPHYLRDKRVHMLGLGCSSLVECVFSICEALCSSHTIKQSKYNLWEVPVLTLFETKRNIITFLHATILL